MRLLLPAVLFVLTGCASAPHIVSLDSGALLVTGLATPGEGGVDASRGKALKLASDHCAELGMRAEVKEITSGEPQDSGYGATDVEFTCVPGA